MECTYSNTAEVQQAIKELKIKTNSKFSVCSTQGSFDKQGIYICLFMYQSVCLSVYLSVDLSIYISIHPSICLSVCLSIYLQWTSLKRTLTGQKFLSTLERCRLGEVQTEKFPNLRYSCFTLDPLSHGLLLPFIWLWECGMVKKK